jgi:hypothetical protein
MLILLLAAVYLLFIYSLLTLARLVINTVKTNEES